jgi:hypothetical protein
MIQLNKKGEENEQEEPQKMEKEVEPEKKNNQIENFIQMKNQSWKSHSLDVQKMFSQITENYQLNPSDIYDFDFDEEHKLLVFQLEDKRVNLKKIIMEIKNI